MGWVRENLFFFTFLAVFWVTYLFERSKLRSGREVLTVLSVKIVSWSLGLFTAVSFILCVLYGLLVPERLHGMSAFLEMMLPAFRWLTFWGFVLGLIESFLYGVYIGIVFVPIYNFINKRWGNKKSKEVKGI